MRLNPPDQSTVNDELRVAWDDSTWPWPSGFRQLPPAPNATPPGGVVALDGQSSLQAEFGNDVSGYGELGVVETLNGQSLAINGVPSSPIPVSSFTNPGCPPGGVGLQMRRMDLATGEATHGLLSLFGRSARVSLHVRVGTTTRVINQDCSGDFGAATDNRHDASTSDPIVPITFDAVFRISPAITPDGRVRLGLLTVADGSSQPTTFARITLCTNSAPDPNSCATQPFPARLSIKQLRAEVLLGDQGA